MAPLVAGVAALLILGGLMASNNKPQPPPPPATPRGGQRRRFNGRVPEYPPNAPQTIELFERAATLAGVPVAWARSPGLHSILGRESAGHVGVPNYTYGARSEDPAAWPGVWAELRAGRLTAKSSATGLGQLLLRNVDRYYPEGRAGIGVAVQEAAGMLRYIRARYGDPDRAWAAYGTKHEGY